jgi:hypothetical protein
MRQRMVCLALCVLAIASSALRGQAVTLPAPLDSGTRLELTPMSGTSMQGPLLKRAARGAPNLHSCLYPGPSCTAGNESPSLTSHTMASSMPVEVQRVSRTIRGGVIGAGIGFLLGSLIKNWRDYICEGDCGQSYYRLGTTLIGGTLGALIGGSTPTSGPMQ